MAGRKTIEAWIKEAINDPDKDESISRLVLFHMTGPVRNELHTRKVKGQLDVPETAAMFRGKAEAHAQDIAGAQTYEIGAFYGTNEPEAFYRLVVNGLAAYEGGQTEAPTPQGMTQQNMRFYESIFQLNYRQSLLMAEAQHRFIERMAAREERLIKEADDAREIVLQVVEQRNTANNDHEMKLAAYNRQTDMTNKMLSFGPALVNTMSGKEVFPQSTADTMLIEKLAEEVKPEHMAMLQHVLPPELAGLLAQRFSKALDDREKVEVAKAKLPISDAARELES